MAICFICETPYQILNALNYALNRDEMRDQRMDVYIGHVFSSYEKNVAVLKKETPFDMLYTYEYSRAKEKLLYKGTHMLAPKVFINRVVGEEINIRQKDYSHIFCSQLTDFAQAMILTFPKAKVCFYDDGMGSYWNRIGLECLTWKRKLFFRVLCKDMNCFYPKALYLNNVGMCKSDWEVEVKPLPPFDTENKEFIGLLQRVFGQYPEAYNTCKTIFLSQPNAAKDQEAFDHHAKMDAAVVDELKKTSFIFRPHPREKFEQDPEITYDLSGSLWELVCLSSITEENILISHCSTAQFTPKLFYDREPMIIFTYKLYSKGEPNPSGDRWLQQLKDEYRDPSRVHAVEHAEEIGALISAWRQKFQS